MILFPFPPPGGNASVGGSFGAEARRKGLNADWLHIRSFVGTDMIHDSELNDWH